MNDPQDNKLIRALFWIYIFVLGWTVLWKIGTPSIGSGVLRTINLTPFFDLKSGTFNSIPEMFSNVVIFVPFGLYISLLMPRSHFIKRVISIFITSFAFETLQYVLALGRSDVTDLIVNTLGGIIGIAIYTLLLRFFGDKANKIITAICVFGTVLALITAGYFFTHIRFREPR